MELSKLTKKLLHYAGKAIAYFNMIQKGDRVLVCLSGGKDSFTLLKVLDFLRIRSNDKFSIFVLTLDSGFPNWDAGVLRKWLNDHAFDFYILKTNINSIVEAKIAKNKIFCSFCSRLRRGIIYKFAKENGFKKIALGHHRDDVIESLLMSIMYSGEISSQPPKLITNDRKHIVIRPLVYCQEKDIAAFAKEESFPIIPCACNAEKKSIRSDLKSLIKNLALENPKIPSNLLHALQAVRTTQLMDKNLCDFKNLEKLLI